MFISKALLLTLATAAPGETVLLEFHSERCPSCVTMAPTMQSLSKAGYPLRRIDVDRHRQLSTAWQVTRLPTFILLVDGKEAGRVVGPASRARLLELFQRARVPASRVVRGQSAAPSRRLPDALALLKGNASSRTAPPPPADPLASSPKTFVPRDVPARTAPSVRQRALAATVRLKVDDAQGHSYGSGTIIDRHGAEALVLTCGHIFRESAGRGEITVEQFDAGGVQSAPGTLIHFDLERDLGLVAFSPPLDVEAVLVGPAGFSMSPGAPVFTIGCDHGGSPSLLSSRITALNKYLGPDNIEVAGEPSDGRSGGGLFSADGFLIGVCNAADPADDEGIYAALPMIHQHLDQIGQTRVYAGRERTAEVAVAEMERAMPAAVAEAAQLPDPVAARALPGDTELLCIVRSKSGDQPDRLMVVRGPSSGLLQQIMRAADARGDGLVPIGQPVSGLQKEGPGRPIIRAQSDDRPRR